MENDEPSSAKSYDPPLAVRISWCSELIHVLAPSSEVGPEPVEVPVTGYSMSVEIKCRGSREVSVLGFMAEILQKSALASDCISLADGRTMATPHFEILLDEVPPLIRPALNADGSRARPDSQLPFTLPPGEYKQLLLAPITDHRELTVWLLYVVIESQGSLLRASYGPFEVTADTGWREFSPRGKPRDLRAGEGCAQQHWTVRSKPTPDQRVCFAKLRAKLPAQT